MAVPRGFIRVSHRYPCPICGKTDWCMISDDDPDDPSRVICPRTESTELWGACGYLHVRKHERGRSPRPPRRVVVESSTARRGVFEALTGLYQRSLKLEQLHQLATDLGVSPDSLRRLGVGLVGGQGFSFPMKAADGRVVGIRIRRFDGSKRSVIGGSEGLFIPTGLIEGDPLLLPEGPSDTAALLDLGFNAIGRPSCNGGRRLLIAYVKRHRLGEAVVIADGDEPGQRGAAALATALTPYVPTVRIVTPPSGIKDARAWKRYGVTHDGVMAEIDAAEPMQISIH